MTEIGAANTLSFGADGIGADNTDASGLIAALPERFGSAGARALVLGAGGSARACAWALARAGAAVAIANRTQARAERLAAELGVEASSAIGPGASLDLAGFDLLVNATSVGLATEGAEPAAAGAELKALRLRADQLVDPLIVVDLVYGSEPTELAATCMSGGATFVDGLEVLVQPGRGFLPHLDRAGATNGDHARRSPTAAETLMSDPPDRPDYLRAVPDAGRRLRGAWSRSPSRAGRPA